MYKSKPIHFTVGYFGDNFTSLWLKLASWPSNLLILIIITSKLRKDHFRTLKTTWILNTWRLFVALAPYINKYLRSVDMHIPYNFVTSFQFLFFFFFVSTKFTFYNILTFRFRAPARFSFIFTFHDSFASPFLHIKFHYLTLYHNLPLPYLLKTNTKLFVYGW